MTLPFRLLAWTPLSHTKYWDTRPFSDRKDSLAENSSIKKLIEALHLNSKDILNQVNKTENLEEEKEEKME